MLQYRILHNYLTCASNSIKDVINPVNVYVLNFSLLHCLLFLTVQHELNHKPGETRMFSHNFLDVFGSLS